MYKCRASPPYEVILRLGQLIVMLPGTVQQILATGHKNIFVAPKKNFPRWFFFGKCWKIIENVYWNPSKIENFHFFDFQLFHFFSELFDFAKIFFRFCKGFFFAKDLKKKSNKNFSKKKCDKNIFSIAQNFFASEGILDRTKVLESLDIDLFKSARKPLEIDLRKNERGKRTAWK